MSVREHDEKTVAELQGLRKSVEKVKVSREVAKALQTVLPNGNISACIEAHVREWTYEPKLPINLLTTEEFARCCLLGYEVDQSPEELIYEYYQATTWVQEKAAVMFVLGTLGIEIKGVNTD